jgi:predicted RNase H-like HicB family nuclease
MSPLRYPATVKVDTAGFYLVTFPDVPEAGTDANT